MPINMIITGSNHIAEILCMGVSRINYTPLCCFFKLITLFYIYYSVYFNRDEGEDVVSVFDENTESWVTMNNNILACLIGITPSLALGKCS